MLGIKERLGFGKKTEQLKTKTNEYCHETFCELSVWAGEKPSVMLREMAIIACLIFKHSRFKEVSSRIRESKLNQQGVVDEIISCYLNQQQSNVVSIDRSNGIR